VLRHTSSIQSVLVYATFFTISLMIHMVVVWPQPSRAGAGDPGGSAEGVAPVASEQPAEGTRTSAARSTGTNGALK
jgi:hypothetical protein